MKLDLSKTPKYDLFWVGWCTTWCLVELLILIFSPSVMTLVWVIINGGCSGFWLWRLNKTSNIIAWLKSKYRLYMM